MQYPIEITEYPHQGSLITWTLWSHSHLMRCISAECGAFEAWAEREGIRVCDIDEEGNVTILTQEAAVYNVENFLDFLRRDLKTVEAKEVE